MKTILYIVPLILGAIFPILFLYARNLGEIRFSDVVGSFIILSTVATIGFLVVRILVKDDVKASLIIISGLFVYHLLHLLSVNLSIVIAVVVVIAMIIFMTRVNNINALRDLNNILRIAFVCLFLFNVVLISVFYLFANKTLYHRITNISANTNNNIYYILLDGYDRQDVLKKEFGYEDRLTDFLQSKGFYVADQSTSNYSWTLCSYPSTLNMKYISEELEGQNSSEYQDTGIKMIKNNVIAMTLKGLEYKYVYVTQGIFSDNEYADYEFSSPIASNISDEERNPQFAKAIMDSLNNFDKVIDIKDKKFVSAYFGCPHAPYVFTSDGQILIDESTNNEYDRIRYIEQLKYMETRIMDIISKILDQDKNAIIVLQSDHGSPVTFSGDSWILEMLKDDNLYERFSILNAFYFPDGDYSLLRKNITSVNTFRIVLKKYFNYEEGLLEERNYYTGPMTPARFIDITDEIRRIQKDKIDAK